MLIKYSQRAEEHTLLSLILLHGMPHEGKMSFPGLHMEMEIRWSRRMIDYPLKSCFLANRSTEHLKDRLVRRREGELSEGEREGERKGNWPLSPPSPVGDRPHPSRREILNVSLKTRSNDSPHPPPTIYHTTSFLQPTTRRMGRPRW